MKNLVVLVCALALVIETYGVDESGATVEGDRTRDSSGTCGDNLKWTFNSSSGVLTISGTGSMYNFQYVDNPWDSFNDSIITVVINNGVATVGADAFYGYDSLVSVTFPPSLRRIDPNAFAGCNNLSSITFSEGLVSISGDAFGACPSLESVSIPSSVTHIDSSAFAFCKKLTEIVVNSSNRIYESIDGVLFNKNESTLVTYPGGKLGGYTIPSFVKKIDDDAFRGCEGLTSVVIPASVTSIGHSAFSFSGNLTSISYLGSSDPEYGFSVFNPCFALKMICVPESFNNDTLCSFDITCRSSFCETVNSQCYDISRADCKPHKKRICFRMGETFKSMRRVLL